MTSLLRRLLAAGLLGSALASAAVASPARVFITDHGAVGDGTTLDTRAIQGAIDACAAAGGGVLVVPKGIFLSGALYFKPGVNLELEKGAVLKATATLRDFPPIYTRWEGVERYWTSAFLNFIGMDHVTVSGEGTIDGSGLEWPGAGDRQRFAAMRRRMAERRPPPPLRTGPYPPASRFYRTPRPTTAALDFAPDPRRLPPVNAAGIPVPGDPDRLAPPRAVVFQNCDDVRVIGVHLRDQARWGFVFIYCRDVVARDLTVQVDAYIPSSDGMDVCSCRDVLIRGCDIACTDDDISIKAGKDADGRRVDLPSENIAVEDCTFGTGGGVAIGSEVSGSVRHVRVEHCRFVGSGSAARIKSQPSRGGTIEDVVYRDIQVSHVARAVSFELSWRMMGPQPPPARVLTVVRGVRLVDFHGTAESGGVVSGFPSSPIRGLAFRDFHVTARLGLVLENVAHPDLSGLHLTVAEGKPVIWQGEGGAP
jgi:polygalacturonase